MCNTFSSLYNNELLGWNIYEIKRDHTFKHIDIDIYLLYLHDHAFDHIKLKVKNNVTFEVILRIGFVTLMYSKYHIDIFRIQHNV